MSKSNKSKKTIKKGGEVANPITGYVKVKEMNEKNGKFFVYPPYAPKKFPLFDGYPDPEKQKEFFKPIEEKYRPDKNKKMFILPKGTVLYRGTIFNKLYPSKSKHVYFGLDILISIWILLETFLKELTNKRVKNIGYIHEFVLNKDIEYYYIDKFIGVPLEHNECLGNTACLKPEAIFHGNDSIIELGTEITLPINLINKKNLDYKKTYVLDILNLLNIMPRSYVDFDPTLFIRKIINKKNILK